MRFELRARSLLLVSPPANDSQVRGTKGERWEELLKSETPGISGVSQIMVKPPTEYIRADGVNLLA